MRKIVYLAMDLHANNCTLGQMDGNIMENQKNSNKLNTSVLLEKIKTRNWECHGHLLSYSFQPLILAK